MNIRTVFLRLAEERKLSHAYLFSGNDKRQKETLLGDVWSLLRVQTPDRLDIAPGEGESAREITIAQIRGLAEFAVLSPWNSPVKGVVIRDAHAMNPEAQSAFLKVLEEPRSATIFFLLTEHPELLFDTIRSRTQEFAFFSLVPVHAPARALAEFKTLRQSTIAERFAYAQKLAQTPEKVSAKVELWLLAARARLHEALKANSKDVQPLLGAVKTMQEIHALLRTTSANPRLALENLLLRL